MGAGRHVVAAFRLLPGRKGRGPGQSLGGPLLGPYLFDGGSLHLVYPEVCGIGSLPASLQKVEHFRQASLLTPHSVVPLAETSSSTRTISSSAVIGPVGGGKGQVG